MENITLDSMSKDIKEGIERILKERGFQLIDEANKKQKSKAFLEYYLKEIGKYLYPFSDDDLIDTGLRCDYKKDLNIDFVYKTDETYYIYQSKHKKLIRDEISGFANIHSRIVDKKFFNDQANDDLKDLLDDFTPKSIVHYVLLTSDKVTDGPGGLKADFEKFTKETHKKFSTCDIDFELKDLSAIKDDYKNARSIDEPIPDFVKIPIEKIEDSFSSIRDYACIDLTSILGSGTKYKTVLTTIKGTELKRLYQQYKGRLFNYNIRGYLGLNSINKKMKSTIEDDPTMFYLFNNGISAICSDLNPLPTSAGHGLVLEAKNFQIINGAQTTCTIGKFTDDSQLKDVRVLLRLTKTEDMKKEKGLNKRIITFNNSQTVIKASDFRSNDDIQLFLKYHLSKYQYKAINPHSKLIYLPKRERFIRRRGEIYLNMETLAKVLYAFNYEPTKIYANSNFLFDTDTSTGGKYWKLFGENGEECSVYLDEHLKWTAAISTLWLFINDKLKNKANETRKEKIEYQTYLAKWHFLWAYGFIIHTFYSDKKTWIANKIIDGKAFQPDNFIEVWFPIIVDKIQDQLEAEYVDSNNKEDADAVTIRSFNFKNWLRNTQSFEKIKLKFQRRKEIFPLTT